MVHSFDHLRQSLLSDAHISTTDDKRTRHQELPVATLESLQLITLLTEPCFEVCYLPALRLYLLLQRISLLDESQSILVECIHL